MLRSRLEGIFSASRTTDARLYDAYCQTVFGMVEHKDIFMLKPRLILLPVKKLFDIGVSYDGDALVSLKKPLYDVGQRRCVYLLRAIEPDWRRPLWCLRCF